MKEKIKKIFKKATIDLVFAWVFVVVCVSVVVDCICKEAYSVGTLVALPYLVIAMQAFELHKAKKDIQEAKAVVAGAVLEALKALRKLRRYEKLYGELPLEEETKEEEKKEE